MKNITTTIELSEAQKGFKKKMLSPFLFGTFLFTKLPLAFFARMKMKSLSAERCEVTLPYAWITTNPFRSIYFAAMNMAAEMSTGAITSMAIFGLNPSVSMLITGLESTFTKKASTKVTFTCEDGAKVFEAINECIATGEPRTVRMKSVGHLADGTEVAVFYFTWSLKQRSKK